MSIVIQESVKETYYRRPDSDAHAQIQLVFHRSIDCSNAFCIANVSKCPKIRSILYIPAIELTAGSKTRPTHCLLIVVEIPSMDSTRSSAVIVTV